jgi:trimethylamine--corrinoid protein Co-methyltransferase
MFNEEQKQILHAATLEVLEQTGVRVLHAGARELLRAAGAEIGADHVVRIPAALVERALQTAPSRIVLAGRRGAREVVLEGWNAYFGTGSDCPNVLDWRTGERRRFTSADAVEAMRLCDALPNVDFVMSVGLVADAPAGASFLRQFEIMLEHNRKPIVFTARDRKDLATIYDLCVSVSGSAEDFRARPIAALYAEPISPLTHGPEAVDKLLFAAAQGLPTVYTPGIMAGGTGPMTLAGTVVTGNAELLSGLVLSQLSAAGAPFIYGGVFTCMDMASAVFLYGAPEFQLFNVALAELAHHYRLPVFGTCGCSDAKVLDEQAAAEITASTLVGALSGANLIHDVGYLESGLTASFEAIVLTDELAGFVRRMTQGLGLANEQLALGEIAAVGPGGHFLDREHTARHFRQELWFPRLFDRRRFDAWKQDGALPLGARLKARVREILS